MLIDSSKLRAIANFVAGAQDVIRKHAELEKALSDKAPQLVDILIRSGQVSQHMKEAKAKSIVDNPEALCEAITKIAEFEPASSIGQGVTLPTGDSELVEKSADKVFEEGLGLSG
jgi:hypothetical protein